MIDKSLSFVMLIVERLNLSRTCPGGPLERYGPFPISTQNEMPWSCSQHWRRKVQSDLLSLGGDLTLSVHHSWISNIIFPWLRHGDSGEDPDQSQQRSETTDRQDFWRCCTKGDGFSLVQLRHSVQWLDMWLCCVVLQAHNRLPNVFVHAFVCWSNMVWFDGEGLNHTFV